MDGKKDQNKDQEQEQDLTPEPKRPRQDNPDKQDKQQGPKRRIRTGKTTHTRGPITKKNQLVRYFTFLST